MMRTLVREKELSCLIDRFPPWSQPSRQASFQPSDSPEAHTASFPLVDDDSQEEEEFFEANEADEREFRASERSFSSGRVCAGS